MNNQQYSVSRPVESALATNSVLRNTYILLGITLLISTITAGFALVTNAAPVGPILTLVGYFGLLFLTTRLSNSPWGLLSVCALTGFMGYTLGPILNMYINGFQNGGQIVMNALGGTTFIFFALSIYVNVTRKDFSFMGGFLFVGILVAFIASLAGLFLQIPALQLAVSAAFVLLSSGLILFHTSQIINGGERNYILATISIYVALFNLFISLLHILGAMNGRD